MTLNAIFYVFAAVLYLAAAFGIYKTLQAVSYTHLTLPTKLEV